MNDWPNLTGANNFILTPSWAYFILVTFNEIYKQTFKKSYSTITYFGLLNIFLFKPRSYWPVLLT